MTAALYKTLPVNPDRSNVALLQLEQTFSMNVGRRGNLTLGNMSKRSYQLMGIFAFWLIHKGQAHIYTSTDPALLCLQKILKVTSIVFFLTFSKQWYTWKGGKHLKTAWFQTYIPFVGKEWEKFCTQWMPASQNKRVRKIMDEIRCCMQWAFFLPFCQVPTISSVGWGGGGYMWPVECLLQ